MKNSDISDILLDIAELIRNGKLGCLKEEAEKFCAIFLAYKYPEDAKIGQERRRLDDSLRNRSK
jgi:hypothetical protein